MIQILIKLLKAFILEKLNSYSIIILFKVVERALCFFSFLPSSFEIKDRS